MNTNEFQLITILVAGAGLLISVVTALQQHIDNKIGVDDIATDVHKQFAEMWFMMDGIFIEYPELHKYFYSYDKKGAYRLKYPEVTEFKDELPDNEEDMERAICIAEKFRDVFQYSEHMAEKIIENYPEDCASYVMYMQRIQSTKIYKTMLTLNQIEVEKDKPIGQALGDKLVTKNYLTYKGEGLDRVYSWVDKEERKKASTGMRLFKNKG